MQHSPSLKSELIHKEKRQKMNPPAVRPINRISVAAPADWNLSQADMVQLSEVPVAHWRTLRLLVEGDYRSIAVNVSMPPIVQQSKSALWLLKGEAGNKGVRLIWDSTSRKGTLYFD